MSYNEVVLLKAQRLSDQSQADWADDVWKFFFIKLPVFSNF